MSWASGVRKKPAKLRSVELKTGVPTSISLGDGSVAPGGCGQVVSDRWWEDPHRRSSPSKGSCWLLLRHVWVPEAVFQIPGQMTHASVTLLLCSRLLAIFISPLNYLRGKREVRLPIETLSKICKALLQGSGNCVFLHFIRAKWERENSERLRYFLKCFLESKSLSLSSALIIDISLQSYGKSSIAGVPEITKP